MKISRSLTLARDTAQQRAFFLTPKPCPKQGSLVTFKRGIMEDQKLKKSEKKAFWVGIGVIFAVFCLLMGILSLVWGGKEEPVKAKKEKPSQPVAEEPVQKKEKSKPAEEPVEEAPSAETHEVQAGDTLFQISLDYNVDWRRIAEVNQLEEDALLKPGQKLIIPPK